MSRQAVISADSHVVEAPEVFAGLESHFGSEAPRLQHTTEEGISAVFPGDAGNSLGVGRLGIAGRRADVQPSRRPHQKPVAEDPRAPEIRRRIREGYEGLRPGLVNGARRFEDQELDGISAEVLYPSFLMRAFNLENASLVTALFRNYNDWIRDYTAGDPERLVGLALLPLQDPGAGLDELRRALAAGFRGACIPCTPPRNTRYSDDAFRPVWNLAEEARIPLSLHVGTGASAGSWDQISADPLMGYAAAPLAVQQTLTSLICGGVLHEHPNLRIVLTEYGTGWIANWLQRLDHAAERTPSAIANGVSRQPSEYWRAQCLATFECDLPGINTRGLVGIENVMWANDYPHRDSTWPCSTELLDEMFCGVSADERHRITYGNAADLYQIKV